MIIIIIIIIVSSFHNVRIFDFSSSCQRVNDTLLMLILNFGGKSLKSSYQVTVPVVYKWFKVVISIISYRANLYHLVTYNKLYPGTDVVCISIEYWCSVLGRKEKEKEQWIHPVPLHLFHFLTLVSYLSVTHSTHWYFCCILTWHFFLVE